VVRLSFKRGDRALTRLRRIVREAAMQSRRSRLPDVLAPAPLEELSRHPGLVLGTVTGNSPAALPAPPDGEWLVVVGPEGGFDPAELELLAPYAQVAVGPHVLRAVTAPVAIAAALAGFRRVAPTDSSDSFGIGRST
jgi:16S rRNA (uracil1498-N3)-methyltransferase